MTAPRAVVVAGVRSLLPAGQADRSAAPPPDRDGGPGRGRRAAGLRDTAGAAGDGLAPGSTSGPSYARNPAAEQALDPAALRRVPASFWRSSDRTDFTAWPTRGDRTEDTRLLRRALAAWARPGRSVVASATPGTPAGPPMGPPQLLYAGEVGEAAVVLFHDGLRVVRYAEPATPTRPGAALDFARVDGAASASANALVVRRTDSGCAI
ncbi:hypothetical protein NKH18_12550 [Streptomyces sp. M10(2022)]